VSHPYNRTAVLRQEILDLIEQRDGDLRSPGLGDLIDTEIERFACEVQTDTLREIRPCDE
jgi:hypothetical protein